MKTGFVGPVGVVLMDIFVRHEYEMEVQHAAGRNYTNVGGGGEPAPQLSVDSLDQMKLSLQILHWQQSHFISAMYCNGIPIVKYS